MIFLLTLLLLGSVSIDAQRRRRPVKQPVKVEDPRIIQMLTGIQQIMFIDSMIVDKQDFVRHIPLSSECGILEMKDSLAQYTNEIGDHRLTTYFNPTDSLLQITVSDYIGNFWTTPTRANGISNNSANFPFMMPDGITLYYAQKGEKSLGGYDLFVTRYDGENDTYLRAENLGMPFASEANDYLYAIDEKYQLGYFVTDRRQPEDKVCIYVFVPNTTRKIYQSEAYSEEKLRSLARIDRISDTWSNMTIRNQALQRLKAARSEATGIKSKHQTTDRKPVSELGNLRHQAEVLEKSLLLARNYYARASENDRQTLRGEIIKSEKELETLQIEIRKKEKMQQNISHP